MRKNRSFKARHRTLLPFLLIFPALLASCTIKLVADYDEVIDRTASELQQEMDRFLTGLEAAPDGPEASFDRNAPFYREYGVKVRSLRVRAGGHEKNDITLQQFDLLENSLEDLRGEHAGSGHLTAGYIQTVRTLFNTSWGAIISWEIAKKRRR